jgi:hypothetical protein
MWGAHCGVFWPQPSSTSQGGQAASCAPPNTLAFRRGSESSGSLEWEFFI